MVWSTFEGIKISERRVTSVTPRPELVPLLAVQAHISGPDRIRTGDLVLDRDVC
jgi:hypothetical protein